MKSLPFLALSLFSWLVFGQQSSAQSTFVHETEREFFSMGDFDGDARVDVVVADRDSGKYRIGYQLKPGTISWVDNRPGGIKGISGFGVGRLFSVKADGLVFSAADANQFSMVEATNPTAAGRPLTVPFSAALGPTVIVPVEVGGEGNTPLADLFVASIYNSPDPDAGTLLRNDGSSFPEVATIGFPGVIAQASRISLKENELMGLLVREQGKSTLHVQNLKAGKLESAGSISDLEEGVHFTAGRLGTEQQQLCTYKPGSTKIRIVPLLETGAPGKASEHDIGKPIKSIFALDHAKTARMLAVFGEGESAGIYNLESGKAPVLAQTIVATNDLFSFAAALPEGFIVLLQPASGKFSTRYQVYHDNGANYTFGNYGSLPSLADNDNITIPEIHARIVSNLKVKTEPEMKVYTNDIPGTRASYVMVPIPGGTFTMGTPESEANRKADEGPQHKVAISPFWMGQCEVTWNEYELFMYPDEERRTRETMKSDPDGDKLADAVTHPSRPYVEMSFGMGKDGFPAISMTQHGANKYCQWLSAKTGHFYRLPTEAEWEYACRAGTTTAYFFGDDPEQLKEYGWFEQNSDFKYQKVGKKKPNRWGLYDMCGNVVEWVLDQYDPEIYTEHAKSGPIMDPWKRATKPYPHAVRGGSWDDEAKSLRSGARRGSDRAWKMQDPQLPKSIWYFSDAQFLGFRIVRPLKVPPAEELQRYWSSGVERD